MKIKNIYRVFIVVLMISFISCSEDLLTEETPHIITSESLYSSLAGFETGLNALYAKVRVEREVTRGENNDPPADMAMNGTDNMVTNHASGFSSIAERWNTLNSPTSGFYSVVFIWLYEIVNASNTIINQALSRDDVDWTGGQGDEETNKNLVIAEAKAIRAWAYRHLTYMWGDVPLSLEESTSSTIKTDWQRTPVAEVRKQMKSDWLFAEQYLNVEPPIAGKISKGAVQHYLAELYLVFNKPDSALFWANKCINTPQYKLITSRYGVKSNEEGVPFMDMFQDGNSNREEGNTEALWVWQWQFQTIGGGASIMRRWHQSRYAEILVGGVRPLQWTVERGGRSQARMALTKWAIDLYEKGDDRGSNYAIRKFFILNDASGNTPAVADILPSGYSYGDTIWLDGSKDITASAKNRLNWPFSRKYGAGTPESDVAGSFQYNDQVYLRLAETYLIKAEAQMLLGYPNDAAATINILRSRAHASPVNGNQINMTFILEERSRELVVEEHRRYTLLRTGTWLERVKLYNKNGGQLATERELLFPIPQIVIDANLTEVMEQNPLY
jgi:hypothetical protein